MFGTENQINKQEFINVYNFFYRNYQIKDKKKGTFLERNKTLIHFQTGEITYVQNPRYLLNASFLKGARVGTCKKKKTLPAKLKQFNYNWISANI